MNEKRLCKICRHRQSRHIGNRCHGSMSHGSECAHGGHKFEPIFAQPLTSPEMTEMVLGLIVSLVTEVIDRTPPAERHRRVYREVTVLGSRVKAILDTHGGNPSPAFYEASAYILDRWNTMIEESGLAPDDGGV